MIQKLLRRISTALRTDPEAGLLSYLDPQWYLATNKDVPEGAAPSHFLQVGMKEGRDPCSLFSTKYYLNAYPDVAAAGSIALEHYARFGWREGRNPHPLFDTSFFQLENLDVSPAEDPLLQYMRRPDLHLRQPHPLFDAIMYMRQVPSLRETRVNPLAHFLAQSGPNYAQPHLLFDPAYYLDRYPEVRGQGANPLLHYLERGSAEGWRPHQMFDGDWYLEQRPDVRSAGANPLVHYVSHGVFEGSLALRPEHSSQGLSMPEQPSVGHSAALALLRDQVQCLRQQLSRESELHLDAARDRELFAEEHARRRWAERPSDVAI